MFHLPGATACASRVLAGAGGLLDCFERLRADPYPWMLDSALPSARLGRHSFAGSDPYLVVRARGTDIEMDCRRAVRPGLVSGRSRFVGDPFDALRALRPQRPPAVPETAVPFVGGAVGYLGYELAGRIEDLAFRGEDDLGLPDLYLLYVDRLLCWDAETECATVHALGFGADDATAEAHAEAAADALVARLGSPASTAPVREPQREPRAACAHFDAGTYAKAVDAAKREIAAGNAYQVCLTHRMERDLAADPWSFYRCLRARNPAPFASYLELPEVVIASSSPERFLRLDAAGAVEARPIKGTRPRGAGDASDRANRAQLAGSAKDRAENLMIVDLVRNDLGRVCETGSVAVPELMAIEDYAAVFQMVSSVCGRLSADRDEVDLIRAAFPPGSMTGAPKIAAMGIIDRLEPVRRGIYSGALGYFDVRGGLDLCVVIRAVFVKDGRAYLHAGGGIVADSDPLDEWRETLDKARPLQEALDASR